MPGKAIAGGRSADIFDVGHGRVLRRYRDPQQSAVAEGEVMEHLRAQEYPVPVVYSGSGPDLVMERIDGPTMLADVARRPWRLGGHAATLAELHRRLHALDPPAGLAAPFGSGRSVLHLDLHPDNVLLSHRGPVVIDWANVAMGPAAADVAQTWVILATSAVPGGPVERRVAGLGQGLFTRAFLRAHGDAAEARAHLVEVARRRRLDQNVRPEERAAIDRLVARAT